MTTNRVDFVFYDRAEGQSNRPFGDFDFTFYYYAQWRQVSSHSVAIRDRDVLRLRDLLAELKPERREFILESARLICEADNESDA